MSLCLWPLDWDELLLLGAEEDAPFGAFRFCGAICGLVTVDIK